MNEALITSGFYALSGSIAFMIIITYVFHLIRKKEENWVKNVLNALILGDYVRWFHFAVITQNICAFYLLTTHGYSWWWAPVLILTVPLSCFIYTWITRLGTFILAGAWVALKFTWKYVKKYLSLFNKGWF